MSARSYKQQVKIFRPLLSSDEDLADIERAAYITQVVLEGCPETDGKRDERVIALARKLVNPDGTMGSVATVNAMNAMLHTAAELLAEQESKRRNRPYKEHEMGEMILAVLPLLAQSKHQLLHIQREAQGRALSRS